MTNGKKKFDQPIKSYIKTYENIQKISAGQGNDYTTCCLLDYNYFKTHHKKIAIDIHKQQALDAYPKVYNKLILLEIYNVFFKICSV